MKILLDGTRIDLTKEEWIAHLDNFAQLVKEDCYFKMEYKKWREITTDAKAGEPSVATFSICYDSNHNDVRVYGWRDRWTFSDHDDSFGLYLLEYLFDIKEEDKVMGDKNNNYYLNPITYSDSISSADIAYSTGISADDLWVAYDYGSNSTSATITSIQEVEEKIQRLADDIAAASPMKDNDEDMNNKENKNMKFNFDFGPVNASTVRMSMYGLAVKNKAGTWVSYDAATGNIVDVDVFNFDGAKFLYKMPVAVKDIAAGDVVIHNSAPMFVLSVGTQTLSVVDVISGERKDIMLATSPFGFNFATKVVNFLGNMMTGAATAENPFGNMWMLMAMSGDNKDMKDMLPMMLMANGSLDMSNPMMLMALMGDGKIDPMMLMAMSTFNKPAATATSGCHCGGSSGHTCSGSCGGNCSHE